MIYVEERKFSRQIDLLRFIASIHSLTICSWLYPESKSTSIAGVPVAEGSSNLQPVTTYGDGVRPRHTKLVEASHRTISAYAEAETEIVSHCDSLALYVAGQDSWFAVTIEHEGMCLVQDESLLPMLSEAGFSVSTEPPSWW